MAKPKPSKPSASQEKSTKTSTSAAANGKDAAKSNNTKVKATTKEVAVTKPSSTSSSSSPFLSYISTGTLVALLGSATLMFVCIFLGELALTSLLKLLFEVVFNERVISLDHAVSQLESPMLLHIAVLLFQLVLVAIVAFVCAMLCSSFLLSTLTSSQDATIAENVLSTGSNTPTILFLIAMAAVRIACHFAHITPSHTMLLMHWSFPFSARIFDSVYWCLIALSIYAATSSNVSWKRIELLERRAQAEHAEALKLYQQKKQEWDEQQRQHSAQIKQAQEIIQRSQQASQNNSPSKDKPAASSAEETPIKKPTQVGTSSASSPTSNSKKGNKQ